MNHLAIVPSIGVPSAEHHRLISLVIKPVSLCSELGLMVMEEKMLRMLLACYPVPVSGEDLQTAIRGHKNFSGNAPFVHISRMRKKLLGTGIDIVTRRKTGFVLTPDGVAKLMRLVGVRA